MGRSIYVTAILTLALSASYVLAQGSGSSRTVPRSSSGPNRSNSAVPASPRPPTQSEFATSFWGYLNNSKGSYRRWGSPGKTKGQEVQTGGAAGRADMTHHAVGQTYLNSTANNDLQRLPMKSVLVREGFAADGQTLENITVMYRTKGVDPANGDWYWMMYLPNGSLASSLPEQGSRPIAGRVQSCIQCHQQAGGKDYVFLNDRPVPGAPQSNQRGRAQGVPQANPDGSGARR